LFKGERRRKKGRVREGKEKEGNKKRRDAENQRKKRKRKKKQRCRGKIWQFLKGNGEKLGVNTCLIYRAFLFDRFSDTITQIMM